MLDNQFDNFVNGKLKDHAAPVPAGVWDKVTDAQFDTFFGDKLKDHAAPVPAGVWDKVTDAQFDTFFGDKLKDHAAPVPAGVWERITDAQFDSFVSSKLTGHVAPVPAGLWEKIQPGEKDDRRGFVLFRNPAAAILVALLLLAGTLGGYFYFRSEKGSHQNTDSTNFQKATGTPETRKENTQLPSQPNGQPAAVVPPATGSGENKTTNLPVTDEANASKPAIENADGHLNTGATTNLIPAERKSSSLRKGLTPASSSNTLTIPGASQSNSRSGLNLAGKRPNANNGLPVYTSDIRSGNEINNNPVVKNNSSANNNLISINKANTEDNSFEFIEPYHTNLLTAINVPSAPVMPGSSFSLSDKQLTAGNHTSKFRNVIICPSDRKGMNTDLYFEAYTSPDLAFRSVSNISASQQYLARKDSSSTMQVGFSAGLRLVKPITENILLKAGIQYTQMNEKFVYRTENEIKTTTVVTVRRIIRAPGDTVVISDTSVVQQIGFKNNTVKNRYRSFDIPVTVGYQFGSEDLKFGVNAGVVFNISSWYQGVLLDSSLATVPLTKTNNMVYKTNIGLGLYAGFSITKRLSDDMHVFVEPYFRYNLSNMTTPQSNYNQKFSLGGVSLGLRFNLNR